MTARLVGVGVGPGDPELLTLKGLQVLRSADVVFVPVLAAGETGRSEAVVRAHVDGERVRQLVFSLDDPDWSTPAAVVADALSDGGTTAFATLGDPNVYSTFTHLARRVAERVQPLDVETVPGITAMQDLAARAATPLVEHDQTLVLLPMTAGIDVLRAALGTFDTVVAYKAGRALPQVLDAVRAAGRLPAAVYGAWLGLPDEDVRPAADIPPDVAAPYLATLIVPPGRRP